MKTIKVTLAVARSGLGFSQARGEEIEVSAAEAKRMLAAGQIAPLTGKLEKAVRDVVLPEEAEAADRAAAAQAILGELAAADQAAADAAAAERAAADAAAAERAAADAAQAEVGAILDATAAAIQAPAADEQAGA